MDCLEAPLELFQDRLSALQPMLGRPSTKVALPAPAGFLPARAVSGKPNRQIRNAFTREWESRQAEIEPFAIQYERVGKPAAIRAREEGDVEHGSAAAGQSAGLIRDVRPVAQVMASIVEEAEAILLKLRNLGQKVALDARREA